MIKFLTKLLGTIFVSDFYILLAAIFTGVIGVLTWKIMKQVEEEVKLCVNDPNKRFAEDLSRRLNVGYNIFTTMITIFPLLGMLGTVKSLIELNLASEEIPALQAHFFDALTSTAWGIVFAVFYKMINSLIEYRIISQIEAAQKTLDKEDVLMNKSGEL